MDVGGARIVRRDPRWRSLVVVAPHGLTILFRSRVAPLERALRIRMRSESSSRALTDPMTMHNDLDPGLAPGVCRPIAPGVSVERRSFLGLAAAALLLARRTGAGTHGATLPDDLELDYEAFLALAVPVARELVADTSRLGEDRYLHTLAALAVRLVDVPIPELRKKGEGYDGPHTWIGANDGGDDDPFVVLHWKMEPGSEIGLHAHTFGNVVTLGLEGVARIRNFEMVGERDFETKSAFRVRRSAEQLLTPGTINLVPLSHGYCHGFVAGREGARGLDITTRIRPKRTAPLLDVADEPADEQGWEYEARWRFE